jgi:quercetin dioxygenase-like cupin family protein
MLRLVKMEPTPMSSTNTVSAQAPIIRKIDDITTSEVERARKATIQVLLGAEEKMPHFYLRRFTLEPGGRIPKHRHDAIEHEQLVLEGEMALSLDGQERIVTEGDCIYIPARVAHAYENRGDAPVRFLCIVPATASYTTEWLE